MLLFISIFFNLFLECLIIFLSTGLLPPWLNLFLGILFFDAIVYEIVFLISLRQFIIGV